jgi:hypothetical protein
MTCPATPPPQKPPDALAVARRNPVADPYAAFLARKAGWLQRYRHKGLQCSAERHPYAAYWTARLRRALKALGCERTLRKAVSAVRSARPHVTNKEALCTLAATEGAVDEAVGKLEDTDFHKEIQVRGCVGR